MQEKIQAISKQDVVSLDLLHRADTVVRAKLPNTIFVLRFAFKLKAARNFTY